MGDRAPVSVASARRAIRARMAKAASLFLALDFDGTLVPIVERPELARPSEEMIAAITSLARIRGVRVMVISGRGLEELRGLLQVQELALAGLHGLETWPPISRQSARIDVHRLRADLDRLLFVLREKLGSAEGPRIEDKRHAIAFHFRGIPRPAAARMRTAVQAAFRETVEESNLVLVPGKEVLEARIAGVEKGSCARAMQEKIASGSLAIVIGDDITDEDLFRAFVKDGIAVVVGSPKKTAARYAIERQADVIPWLREVEALWRETRPEG